MAKRFHIEATILMGDGYDGDADYMAQNVGFALSARYAKVIDITVKQEVDSEQSNQTSWGSLGGR